MTASEIPTESRRRGRWASTALVVFFGLFYAYDLWEAVSTFLELPTFYRAFGFDVDRLPWWILILMLVLPVAAFGVAVWAGRGRALAERALILFLGLAVVAALGLGLIALEAVVRPPLLAG